MTRDDNGTAWRTSTYSMGNGACVQAASWRRRGEPGPAVTGVRDSTLGQASPVLEFPAAAWRDFTASLKAIRD